LVILVVVPPILEPRADSGWAIDHVDIEQVYRHDDRYSIHSRACMLGIDAESRANARRLDAVIVPIIYGGETYLLSTGSCSGQLGKGKDSDH
jgi:hypothetical protein